MPLRICDNGVSILNADRVAELVQCTGGVEKVAEFPVTVQIDRMEYDVVMKRGLSRMIFIAPFMHTSNNDTYLYDDEELDVCNGFQYRYHESVPHREGM